MPKKVKFSLEEEEKIINFVKSHEMLYNVKNKRFRDTEAKNRLWLQLGNEFCMEAESVKKKWQTMRDYYVRNKDKKTTGSAASTTKRDESLAFLVQTSVMKRPSISSLQSTSSENEIQSEVRQPETDSAVNADQTWSAIDSASFAIAELESSSDDSFLPDPASQVHSSKKRKSSQTLDTNDILREFLATRPKPSDFLPQTPVDETQLFFDSMAATVRKLSSLAVARIKLKIAQMIGEEEIAWANENVEVVYMSDQQE